MLLSIKCKICDEIYEDPVLLPCCSKSICIKHIKLINETKYSCELCNNYIQLPLYGFRYDNRAIKQFILSFFFLLVLIYSKLNLNIKIDDYTVHYSTANNCIAKQACQNLSEQIKQNEQLANYPQV